MDTKISKLMKAKGLDDKSVLYRYSLIEYLDKLEDGSTIINANPSATEMVEDVYGSGHILMASSFGPGLSFTIQPEEEFNSEEHTLVSVKLGDVLEQGGKIYPDKSTYTLNAYYLTIPAGMIKVQLKES